MPSLRPLRFVGPALLAAGVAIAVLVGPADSTLALMQVGLLLFGSVLVTVAAFGNPLRGLLGWRPLLGLGEISIGAAVPLGVLGTGVESSFDTFYGLLTAVAGVGLLVVIGSQVLSDRT